MQCSVNDAPHSRNANGARGKNGEALGGEVEEIKEQLSRLQEVVLLQQEVLEGQRKELEEVKKERRWSGEKSPLESQAVAIGDRRLVGKFDARFHSLSL